MGTANTNRDVTKNVNGEIDNRAVTKNVNGEIANRAVTKNVNGEIANRAVTKNVNGEIDNRAVTKNVNGESDVEREKYSKAWMNDDYRTFSPGENMIMPFMMTAKPDTGSSITDFGSGTGRASLFFHECGLQVQMVDIADNCLDKEVKEKIGDKLIIGNLWEQIVGLKHSDIGYCCDVMEHIPEFYVTEVIENIVERCDKAFFHICFHEDHFGKQMGEVLHLTVRPFKWWLKVLEHFGTVTDARDLLFNGMFIVENANRAVTKNVNGEMGNRAVTKNVNGEMDNRAVTKNVNGESGGNDNG